MVGVRPSRGFPPCVHGRRARDLLHGAELVLQVLPGRGADIAGLLRLPRGSGQL